MKTYKVIYSKVTSAFSVSLILFGHPLLKIFQLLKKTLRVEILHIWTGFTFV